MEQQCIPFMGDEAISPTTSPAQIANWVQQDDKIPLLLAISLYTNPRNINDFILQKDTFHAKTAAAWINSAGLAVVGIAGTNNIKDLKDDQVGLFNLSLFTLFYLFQSLFNLVHLFTHLCDIINNHNYNFSSLLSINQALLENVVYQLFLGFFNFHFIFNKLGNSRFWKFIL